MTMPSTTTYMPTSAVRRRVVLLLAWLRRAANTWVAAMLAYRERQAALHALQEFSDHQLKDIGLYRGQLDYVIDEASRQRIRGGLWR